MIINNNNLVMFLSDGRNLELNAAAVNNEGVSRGVWDASKRASWSTLKNEIIHHVTHMQRQIFQK